MFPIGAAAFLNQEINLRVRPLLLFFVLDDWYFASHRLHMAKAAMRQGYEVALLTCPGDLRPHLEQQGIRVLEIMLSRTGINPFKDLLAVANIARIYRKERPDIVHHVALKPVIYGTIAATLAGVRNVVNALAGLGFVFSSSHVIARRLKPMVTAILGFALRCRRSYVIVQNPDDRTWVESNLDVPPDRIYMIRGAGVDIARFRPTAEPQGAPVVLFAARLLREKGICEFVEAADRLKREGVTARFVVAGRLDPASPAAIAECWLREQHERGIIEWVGHRSDMPDLIAKSTIVCLPSYREGLPRFLLEAAACGRAIVASDTPGCREVVRHGENGLLVPARDPVALADAITVVLSQRDLRQRMGVHGRSVVEAQFSEPDIAAQLLQMYRELLLLSRTSGAAAIDPARQKGS